MRPFSSTQPGQGETKTFISATSSGRNLHEIRPSERKTADLAYTGKGRDSYGGQSPVFAWEDIMAIGLMAANVPTIEFAEPERVSFSDSEF